MKKTEKTIIRMISEERGHELRKNNEKWCKLVKQEKNVN